MKTRLIVATALFMVASGRAHAVPVLDQAFTGPASVAFLINENIEHAQTVRAELTGKLTSIEVFIGADPRTAGSLSLHVLDMAGVNPGTTILATSLNSLAAAAVTTDGFFSFDFNSANFFVTAGSLFSFSVDGAGPSSFFGLYSSTSNSSPSYFPGSRYFRNTSADGWSAPAAGDLLFRTFVDGSVQPPPPVSQVPEPTSLALLGLSLVGFAAARRKS